MPKAQSMISAAIGIFAITGVGSATAADLPARTYTKAPPVAPAYNWTGCYVGAEGGGNWGRTDSIAVNTPGGVFIGLPITNRYDLAGGLAGGTAGCNYQTGQFVIGIEGDASWTNKSGSANDVAPFPVTSTNNLEERWFDTVRGRVGYAWDKVLLYATAGGAFAGTRLTLCTVAAICAADSETRSGWTAGAGVEFAVLDNWSVKLEYLHADFGSKNYFSPLRVLPGATFDTRSVSLTDDMVRVGVNYRFNWNGPVVARY
jgi:outer membrane immunogenic protein